MKRSTIMVVTAAAAVLAACAAMPPGASSVAVGDRPAQVQAKLGAPKLERKLASGATAWYFPTGPSGFYTWRVVFDPAGVATEYGQVLTAKNFASFAQGAPPDALLDRLGPPMERMTFALSKTEAWTYRWMDGTLEMIADVVFDPGGLRHIALYRDPAFSSTVSGDGSTK